MKRIVVYSIIVAFSIWGLFFSPGGREMRDLPLAKKHRPIIINALNKDQRFLKIIVRATTVPGKILSLHGTVTSDATLKNLKKIVNQTNPPIAVHYDIKIKP